MRVDRSAEGVGNGLRQAVKAVVGERRGSRRAPEERHLVLGIDNVVELERGSWGLPLAYFRILPVIDHAVGVARRSRYAERLRHEALDLRGDGIEARGIDLVVQEWIGDDLAVGGHVSGERVVNRIGD